MSGIRGPRQRRPERQRNHGRGERPRPRRQKPLLHGTLLMDNEPPSKPGKAAEQRLPLGGAHSFLNLSSFCYCKIRSQYTRFVLFYHIFLPCRKDCWNPLRPSFCASRPSWESWRLHRSRISTQSRLAICSSCQYNVIVSKRHIASMNGCIPEPLCNGNTVSLQQRKALPEFERNGISSQKRHLFPPQALNKSVFLLSPNIFIAKKVARKP